MKKIPLGGARLGSGNKNSIYMDGYHSSNHDLSFVFRSTMDCGTLVPFCKIPMTIGDNFDIDVSSIIKTLPTGGPLYGSFKWQVDFFFCPNRLYIGGLHNNATGIGRKMGQVLLPTITQTVLPQKMNPGMDDPNQTQVAPDSLCAYLGIRGFGENVSGEEQKRSFNGIPFLAVPDIFKNYYANKQEPIAYMISAMEDDGYNKIYGLKNAYDGNYNIIPENTPNELGSNTKERTFYLEFEEEASTTVGNRTLSIDWAYSNGVKKTITLLFGVKNYISSEENGQQAWYVTPIFTQNQLGNVIMLQFQPVNFQAIRQNYVSFNKNTELEIEFLSKEQGANIKSFPLENIDNARDIILSKSKIGQKVDISNLGDIDFSPYVDNAIVIGSGNSKRNATATAKNGLLLRTYMSDIYNNWVRTEWIDEINIASAIQTDEMGSFTMDALIVKKRLWNYMNRVAVSDGTYQSWEEATWGRDAQKFCESPIYMGGGSGIISFEEVVSTATSGDEALGSLAGQGNLHSQKGGKVNVKAQEIGYLIGIVSIVPYIDYYQGNDWDMTELINMESYHMPEFDGIGFQDLITERLAAWDTKITSQGLIKKSIGKQPAWLQYMSNHNKVYGDFCRKGNADYMVITREYQPTQGSQGIEIGDLTTYVFPQHYNYLFASKDIEVNPFWVQIGCDIFARRIMSAAIMPTL